jgi:hypothetical protein
MNSLCLESNLISFTNRVLIAVNVESRLIADVLREKDVYIAINTILG